MRTPGPWALAFPAFAYAIVAGFVILGLGVRDQTEALIMLGVAPAVVFAGSLLSIAFAHREPVMEVRPEFEDRADGFVVEWLEPADFATRIWSVAAASSMGWIIPGVSWMELGEAFGFSCLAAMLSFGAAAVGVFLIARRFLHHRVELVGRVVVVDGARVVLEEPQAQVELQGVGRWSRLVLRGARETVQLVGDHATVERIAVRLRSLPRARGSATDVPAELRQLQDAE